MWCTHMWAVGSDPLSTTGGAAPTARRRAQQTYGLPACLPHLGADKLLILVRRPLVLPAVQDDAWEGEWLQGPWVVGSLG